MSDNRGPVYHGGTIHYSHETAPKATPRFEVGRTYSTRSICDHDCVYSFTILARTAKSVTVEVHGKTVRRGLSIYDGVEQFKPFGSYSMAAIISADKGAIAQAEG